MKNLMTMMMVMCLVVAAGSASAEVFLFNVDYGPNAGGTGLSEDDTLYVGPAVFGFEPDDYWHWRGGVPHSWKSDRTRWEGTETWFGSGGPIDLSEDDMSPNPLLGTAFSPWDWGTSTPTGGDASYGLQNFDDYVGQTMWLVVYSGGDGTDKYITDITVNTNIPQDDPQDPDNPTVVTVTSTGTNSPYFIEGENYWIFEVTPAGWGGVSIDISPAEGAEYALISGAQLTNAEEPPFFFRQRGQAHSPVPASGRTDVDSTTVTSVSWFSPLQDLQGMEDPDLDPDIVSVDQYDVYFGTAEPGAGEPSVVTPPEQSLEVDLDFETTYFWRVDTHVTWADEQESIVEGNVWRFTTLPDYIPPSVDFPSIITTLDLSPAVLSATVTDNSDPLTDVEFEIVTFADGADPNFVDLEEVTIELDNPIATLAVPNEARYEGLYEVSLTVSDDVGDPVEVIASVQFFVDPCDAAKAVPGYEANPFDLNDDCFVNLADLAIFIEQWLDDQRLKDQVDLQ